ncbi:MAG: sulfotransferase family protein [Actinomycetales bacterium]
MGERPIFLVGCPRSGTTLLTTMLHAHPRLAFPPETRFLLPAYESRATFGDLTVRANRVQLARRITGKGTRFRDLGLDRKTVVEAIADGPPTLGSALGIVWREFATSRGKVRWGEKRPAYWRHMDVVSALFPEAQFVHLVRDPRACVASLLRVSWAEGGVEDAAAVWVLADREIRRFSRRVGPASYHALQYEELVAQPERVLAALCDFLGEQFDPSMLSYQGAAHDIVPDRKTWHDNTKGALDVSRTEAWRTQLTPSEIRLVELAARSGMRRWGYRPSGVRVRPAATAVARYEATLARRIASIERDRVGAALQARRSKEVLASRL